MPRFVFHRRVILSGVSLFIFFGVESYLHLRRGFLFWSVLLFFLGVAMLAVGCFDIVWWMYIYLGTHLNNFH
jgi:hypothetical protein